MVLFGTLIGMDIFANPSPLLGERFPEWNGYKEGNWWFGPWPGEAGNHPSVRWLFSLDDSANLGMPPATWGSPTSPTHSTFGWGVAYMGQVVPAQIGSACAIYILGAERFAPKMVQAVRQHMQGPPQSARDELQALGLGHLNPTWGGGTEETYAGPAHFSAYCWRRYAR